MNFQPNILLKQKCVLIQFSFCYTEMKFKAVYKTSYFVPSIFNYFWKEAVFLWLENGKYSWHNIQGLIISCTNQSLTEEQLKCIYTTLSHAKPQGSAHWATARFKSLQVFSFLSQIWQKFSQTAQTYKAAFWQHSTWSLSSFSHSFPALPSLPKHCRKEERRGQSWYFDNYCDALTQTTVMAKWPCWSLN